ncbi:XRE family transcriptional regulator [Butyricicoccus sp. 1XD8-22]|nr:XRE family transcriptional regulator [Butyricicoccus sp. 1XD8-22]
MFHIKLKHIRERANISRDQLADYLNVSYSTVANYETNERQPDLNTLKKIAEFFNVSIDYMLDVPYTTEHIMNDISVYFEAIKSIVKDSKDVYFNSNTLSNTSKEFVLESIEFISGQIVNINDGES